MKKNYFIPLLLASSFRLLTAQTLSPDTLLVEPVTGDPVSQMPTAPSGSDISWVNFDRDHGNGLCVSDDVTPMGWYVESDFGITDPNVFNDAFTSCSYLTDDKLRNDNWLILPPVQLPDSSYYLCWRSLPVEGPAFMDGYEVRLSTGSNDPGDGDYTHLLFTAAEMIKPKVDGNLTLDPDDYIFSPGYIHANGYTDTSYFYKDLPNGPLRGRMEPHCVSLSGYQGEALYIAFHHNSLNDNQLQIDDILISNAPTVGTQQPAELVSLRIMPNPAGVKTFVSWNMADPAPGKLLLRDLSGQTILTRSFGAYESGSLFLDLSAVAPGVYFCTMETTRGAATRKLIRL